MRTVIAQKARPHDTVICRPRTAPSCLNAVSADLSSSTRRPRHAPPSGTTESATPPNHCELSAGNRLR